MFSPRTDSSSRCWGRIVGGSGILARLAPHGGYLSVPHGGHLLGNARPDWLPHLGDHLVRTLTGTPE
ncbi:hypothetical protein ACFWCB_09670 [Streptomyces sp. NPDC060048]|uniref:hypothetical protein n=1 Tax=unclassified Streptomyces TaxID=2593676 RepID=UPI0036A340EB